MAGAITATLEITGSMTDAAFLTELNTLDVGAATAGTETATIYIVPHGNGQASVFKLARAA
jgi:hypothetical protein